MGRGVKKKSSSHGSDNNLAGSLCSSGKAYPRAAGSERSASPRALVVVSFLLGRVSNEYVSMSPIVCSASVASDLAYDRLNIFTRPG